MHTHILTQEEEAFSIIGKIQPIVSDVKAAKKKLFEKNHTVSCK